LQTHTHKQPPPFANPISRESSPLESACFDFSPLPPPAAAAVEFELDFQASPTEISSLQTLEEEEEEERKNERTKEEEVLICGGHLLLLLLYVCALARLHSFASLRLVIRFRFWICATSN